MDVTRKLEILARADFSEWRKWERAKAAGVPIADVHGFGNILFGMGGAISMLADGLGDEDSLNRLLEGYATIKSDYASIPFSEMDPADEDFRFLFNYKGLIDQLEVKIRAFHEKLDTNDMQGSRSWNEFVALWDSIAVLRQQNYRSQVLDRYDISFTNPKI